MDERYKAIMLKRNDFDKVQKLALATGRTKAGMISIMLEAYIKSIPVVGKIVDGRVILEGEFAGSDTERE